MWQSFALFSIYGGLTGLFVLSKQFVDYPYQDLIQYSKDLSGPICQSDFATKLRLTEVVGVFLNSPLSPNVSMLAEWCFLFTYNYAHHRS
jgi:hypothetical protein